MQGEAPAAINQPRKLTAEGVLAGSCSWAARTLGTEGGVIAEMP